MEFNVSFYRSGDRKENSLIAREAVIASDEGKAVAVARGKLTARYPEVAQCMFWCVDLYGERRRKG